MVSSHRFPPQKMTNGIILLRLKIMRTFVKNLQTRPKGPLSFGEVWAVLSACWVCSWTELDNYFQN